MASRPWTDEDRAFLEGLSHRRDWIRDAVARFPDRTESAIRNAMQQVRITQGGGDSRFVDAPWMAKAANSSRQLLEALIATGLRP